MRLSELTTIGAVELGMEPSEVKTRVRSIREGGFITSGPRGPGAPHMNARDLAAFILGAVLSIEPTRSGHGLRELLRASFGGCEWMNLTLLEGNVGRDENAQPVKYIWHSAPLSPVFGARLEVSDLLTCLAELLANLSSAPVTLRSIGCEATGDGVTVSLIYNELATSDCMRRRYVEYSGDASDGYFFGERQEVEKWTVTIRYLLSEPQRDRRRHVVEVPGEAVARLARLVLGVAA